MRGSLPGAGYLGVEEDGNRRHQVREEWRQTVLGETPGIWGHLWDELET